jgi:hypothetical protein
MNWKQLKDFCNSLPESELEKNVILWREDEAITKIEAESLKEDHYIDIENSENGCFPEYQMKSFISEDEEAYPNGEKDFKKCYDKGHPILLEDF